MKMYQRIAAYGVESHELFFVSTKQVAAEGFIERARALRPHADIKA